MSILCNSYHCQHVEDVIFQNHLSFFARYYGSTGSPSHLNRPKVLPLATPRVQKIARLWFAHRVPILDDLLRRWRSEQSLQRMHELWDARAVWEGSSDQDLTDDVQETELEQSQSEARY